MKFKPSLILYVVSGVFFFIFWMIVVFPYDALNSRILTEINNQTGGRYQIDMKDMDISLLGSVTFEDLKVHDQASGKKELLLKTPKLKIGFSPLGLLSKKMDFDFYLKGTKKGEVEGSFGQNEDTTRLSLNFDEFPLSELRMLAQKTKVVLKGNLEGDVDLVINPRHPADNDGKIDLELVNLATEPTSIALDPNDPATAMNLPEIRLSGPKGSHLKAVVAKERMDIQSIKLSGGDIDLDLKGSIILTGTRARDYRLDIKGNFKISDKLAKSLPILFLIEKQKNEQGVYPLSVTGRLGRPNILIGKLRVPL